MFKSAADSSFTELEARCKTETKLMRFGVQFLDEALRGIFPDDLILLGAPSGVGKTQLCCNMALANMEDGRKVHYIALEAAEFEIERRLKYPLVLERFYSDSTRANLGKVNFTDWLLGKYLAEMQTHEMAAAEHFEKAYKDLFLFYKGDRFGLSQLIEYVCLVSEKTDLIIIDHVHYFDFDDDNENRAMREIAKTVRTLALEQQKPIVLVAHLRKRDRMNDDLVAGLDEFHGTSDLYKIATRVITVAPGKMTTDGKFETYFRIPKNRLDGGVSRFCAKELFNPREGKYERNKYQLGWAGQSRKSGFEPIDRSLYPDWATGGRSNIGGSSADLPQRETWIDRL